MSFAFHLLCIILLQCNSAFAMQTVALVGDSTILYCNGSIGSVINWLHYRLGGDTIQTDATDVFMDNAITKEYSTRFRIDTSQNSSNLIIENVTTNLAGRYVCKDVKINEDINVTQLIVLECHVNANEFIGPNDCNIPLDDIQLSCNVGYHGNNEPELEWKKHGQTTRVIGSSCTKESSTLTKCKTKVKPDVEVALNGSHFICQIKSSVAEEQYNCTANITVIYAFSSEESQRTTIYRGDKIFCVANSSQSCSYKWVWYERIGNDISRTIESMDNILIARKTGLHRCEAQCDLRNEACLVYPRFVDVIASEESLGQDHSGLQQPLEQEEENCQWTPSDKGLLIMGVLPYVAFVGFGLCYLFKLRKKKAGGNQDKTSETSSETRE